MLARVQKVPLRHIPLFFSEAKKIKRDGFSLYYCGNTQNMLRFSCILTSKGGNSTAVTRSRAKRLLYGVIEKINKKKLVYNLDIVCVLYSLPSHQLLESLKHEISLFAIPSV